MQAGPRKLLLSLAVATSCISAPVRAQEPHPTIGMTQGEVLACAGLPDQTLEAGRSPIGSIAGKSRSASPVTGAKQH